MFFDDWYGLLRVLIVGVCSYVWLIALLRFSGKRTLSKMNAFDWILTVAMGSTLATILLSSTVVLLEAMLAFVLLVGLQFLVAWLSSRSNAFSRVVKSEPTLLMYQGEMLHEQLRKERVHPAEVRQAIRSSGVGKLEAVDAVVLETDGKLSVIARGERLTALRDVTYQDHSQTPVTDENATRSD